MSNQDSVQKEIERLTQKKRKQMTSWERVRLLQLKLYQKAKQENYNRKSQRKSNLHGKQAFDLLTSFYGLIKAYKPSGLRPVNAL